VRGAGATRSLEAGGELRSHGSTDVTIVANDIGPVGGMERAIVQLILGLRELGHRVTVVARTCELPPGTEVEFHRVRGPGRPALLAYPWFLIAGSLALRRWRRGVVQSTGGIVLNRVDVVSVHYCHQVGPANPSRATPLFRIHARAVSVMNRLGERLCYLMQRTATFVCVSEGVCDEMREHHPRLRERLATIQNGVDVDLFAPGRRAEAARKMREEMQTTPGRLVALFVGSEWEGKGLAPLISALALAPGWELLVVGRGERVRYEELARSAGVTAAVHWLGVSKDVQLLYQLADAFVLPSSYETFSLVTFEAAASGLPVLVTPVSGVRELIEDGVSGMLIAPQPESIAAKLRQLGEDEELRRRLGRAARESASEFSWGRMVARYHELYERLSRARAQVSR
jgi:glycosyltransferase involved in cell wall biosynthesis